MPMMQIFGWMLVGFLVAAVGLYGPTAVMAMMARSQSRAIKHRNIQLMKEAIADKQEINGLIQGSSEAEAQYHEKYNKLQDEQIALLHELVQCRQELNTMLEKYETVSNEYTDLLKKHEALLGRQPSEGTA